MNKQPTMKARIKKLACVIAGAGLLAGCQPVGAGGWYLMYPPATGAGVQDELPIADWSEVHAYTFAWTCENGKAEYYQRAFDLTKDPASLEKYVRRMGWLLPPPSEMAAGSLPPPSGAQIVLDRAQAALCVSSDDPRLAKVSR
jgi:hypothetical protein